jgi:glycosyltransferase involved in cell wall biosynthesis
MKDPSISIILPVYRQADHIRSVVHEYVDALAQIKAVHEILLVVNGPTDDGSVDVCRSVEGEFESVRAITSEIPGWGRAVRVGIESSRGDLICYTNSARTSAKDLTDVLTTALGQGDAIVKATRKIREGFVRRLGSLLYNLECRALFDLPYWDINGTPKVFPRTFTRLLTLTRDDDLLDLEFLVTCIEEDHPVISVSTFSAIRHGGKSTTGVRAALRLYYGAIAMRSQWRRR